MKKIKMYVGSGHWGWGGVKLIKAKPMSYHEYAKQYKLKILIDEDAPGYWVGLAPQKVKEEKYVNPEEYGDYPPNIIFNGPLEEGCHRIIWLPKKIFEKHYWLKKEKS